jgi:membrane protease YdiL (CAAX protease family)
MTGERLSARRIARDAGQALAWALGLSALIFPIFWLGYVVWYEPPAQFVPARVPALFDDVLGQLLVIALPEEAFYRGYLQTELDQRLPAGRRKILGVELGPGWLLANLIFALGHLLTDLHPSRLAVFFPGLLFGWLRVKTRGIGSAVVFHAACNLFATYLGRSYGLLR